MPVLRVSVKNHNSSKVKKGIKDTVALLVVCCLLFGSLTLGSVILSSCSPKNNPVDRGVIDTAPTELLTLW